MDILGFRIEKFKQYPKVSMDITDTTSKNMFIAILKDWKSLMAAFFMFFSLVFVVSYALFINYQKFQTCEQIKKAIEKYNAFYVSCE